MNEKGRTTNAHEYHLSPALFSVEEVEHMWIRMSDGVRLAARLWLPERPDGMPTPAILEYIPYRKRDISRARDESNHPVFARHGYACVRVDMRGSGDSEGVKADMYSPEEFDDAIEVIDWIADQPWCDGTVGMMGTSWGGTACLQAAARRPEGLKAVIAVCATHNRFDDDIHHMGGCLLTDTVEWGITLPVILASPPDPDTVGPGWRELWQQRLEALSFPVEHWVRHETCDAYWRTGAVNEIPDAIQCPVLAVGGWADRYSNTVMPLLAQSHERCWGIVGPWGHHYPDVGSPGPGMAFQQEAIRWWDRWLKGADNGVETLPKLRAWMQDYVQPANRIERRPGRWVGESSWPSARIELTELYLSAGRLQPQPNSKRETVGVPASLAVGSAAGDTGYFGRDGGLPLDQSDDDAHSLVFETGPLETAIEILGSAGLSVSLDSDQAVATLAARLNDVPPDGGVSRVAYAVRNLALDDNGEREDQWVPGESRSVEVRFPHTAYRFARGHRIRLALSSAYWPLIWPAPRSPCITLHLNHARLKLPVRLGSDRDNHIVMAAPERQINPGITELSTPALERWVDRVDAIGRRSIGWHQPLRRVRFNAIDLEFGLETHAEHCIEPRDPTSASSRFEHRLHYHRNNWTVDVSGHARLTSTETEYCLEGAVEVRENGEVIFYREWAPVIPRTCS